MLICSVMSDSFVILWTVAQQASLSMVFSKQEYWRGLPFASPGDLSDLGIKAGSPALQADSLQSEPPGKPQQVTIRASKTESCKFWRPGVQNQGIGGAAFFWRLRENPHSVSLPASGSFQQSLAFLGL